MPTFARLLLLLLLTTPAWAAETRYISDELRVPLRKSPCNGCAIIHRGLVAGTKLTLNNTENDWASVTTSSGLSGWLPLQYLVSKPIARDLLNAAEANTRMIAEENADLKNRVSELESSLNEVEKQNAELSLTNKDLETELLAIKKLSSNALSLQEQNETLVKQNRMLQSEVDVLTATRDQLSNDNSRQWFLYGGITVCLGALLTVLVPRLRPRKKRFSEWA